MSRAEPTAGAWYAGEPRRGRGGALAAVDIESDGQLVGRGFGDDEHEATANARLFAGSKDLLAACERAYEFMSELCSDGDIAGELRAAIAKAKGAS